MTAPVEYRRAEPEDMTFVVSSWTSSYKSAHAAGILSITPLAVPCASCGAPQDYDFSTVMGHTIRNLLQRPGLEVWVAVNPRARADKRLHGYLVVERDANIPSYEWPTFERRIKHAKELLIHFVFVKQTYRGFGIARALVEAAGLKVDSFIDDEGKARSVIHSPFLYTCKTPAVGQLEGVEKGRLVRANKIPRARWSPLSVRFAKESEIHDQDRNEAPLQDRAPRTAR